MCLANVLYGRPDSGACWEAHCDARVRRGGYEPAGEGWPACYVHPQLKLFLVLYVDDFKLAGPTANLAEGWRLLRSHLSIEPAKPIGLYLGCHHDIQPVCHTDGTVVKVMPYNMEEFLQ